MPATTADLELPGRLLLWTARHWARGRSRCTDLPRFVRLTLDQLPGGGEVREAVETLVAALAQGARRPLCLAAPEAAALTHDERALVLALTAARAGLLDEARHAVADLQHGGGLRCTTERLARVGDALARHGLGVLRPATDPGAVAARLLSSPRPTPRTVRPGHGPA